MKKTLGIFGLAVCALGLVGCSGSNPFVEKPRIAFANALRTDTSIVAKVDGVNKTGTLARGAVSTDQEFDNGYRTVVIENLSGTKLAERNDFLFEEKTNYIGIVFNNQAGGGSSESVDLKFTRENEVTTSGKATVHFTRATSRFGDVDIYVVPSGGTTETSKKFTINTTGTDDQLETFDPGTYDIRVFAKDTVTPRLNGLAEFTLDSTTNYLFIFTAEGELETATAKFIPYVER